MCPFLFVKRTYHNSRKSKLIFGYKNERLTVAAFFSLAEFEQRGIARLIKV